MDMKTSRMLAWAIPMALVSISGLAAIVASVEPRVPRRRRNPPDVLPDFANPVRFIPGTLPLAYQGGREERPEGDGPEQDQDPCTCEPEVARVNRSGRCQVCGFMATTRPHLHTSRELRARRALTRR